MTTASFPKPASAACSEALARAGFTPASGADYARGEFRLTIGSLWCVIEAPPAGSPAAHRTHSVIPIEEPPPSPQPSPPGRGRADDTVETSRVSSRVCTSPPDAASNSAYCADRRRAPSPGGEGRGEGRGEGGQFSLITITGRAAALGTPGPWKHVGAAGDARLIFALPRRVWDEASSADTSFDGEITVLDQCLQWALDTAEQSIPAEWQSPLRAVVESWFKPEQLTVVAGPLLRQGEVICEPAQLTIRFPLVPELPPDLPESRRAWLHALLDEAQDRWHLVRLDVVSDDDGQSSVVAEVDLTGVPHELAEDLFVISLEALRWVVQWLGETTDWLADATVASELLAVCPNNQPQESP